MNWYLDVLKKYAEFDGRARRKEYWIFVLFNMIVVALLSFVEGLVGIPSFGGRGMLVLLYLFAVLLPALGVGVRRLHDTGRTGWWLLLGVIPFIGPIVILLFTVKDSEPGDNQYGPNPKVVVQAA